MISINRFAARAIKIHVTTDSGNEVELRREGVIYCPEFKVNLLSVRKEINDYGSTLLFSHTPGGNSISLQNEEVVPFYDDGRNYRLSFATVTERTKAIQPRQKQRTSNAYAIHKIEDMSDLLLVHYPIGWRMQAPRYVRSTTIN